MKVRIILYLLGIIFFMSNIHAQKKGSMRPLPKYWIYSYNDGRDIPIGKNANYTYDEFFKNYIVKYTDKNGYKVEAEFVFNTNKQYPKEFWTYKGKIYLIDVLGDLVIFHEMDSNGRFLLTNHY